MMESNPMNQNQTMNRKNQARRVQGATPKCITQRKPKEPPGRARKRGRGAGEGVKNHARNEGVNPLSSKTKLGRKTSKK